MTNSNNMRAFLKESWQYIKKIFSRRDEEAERSPYAQEEVSKVSKKEMVERIAELIKRGSDDG